MTAALTVAVACVAVWAVLYSIRRYGPVDPPTQLRRRQLDAIAERDRVRP